MQSEAPDIGRNEQDPHGHMRGTVASMGAGCHLHTYLSVVVWDGLRYVCGQLFFYAITWVHSTMLCSCFAG